MKTFFMILFMGFTFFTPNETITEIPTALERDNVESPVIEEARSTRGYVTFGRKRRRCKGFGICSAYIATTNTENGTGTVFGISGNRIVYLRWSRKEARKSSQAKQFEEGTLVIEEDVEETLESKGEKFILNIKAGKYKLREDGDGFLLEVSG